MADRRSVIYPARRAVEYALSTPSARPKRLFALLLPVWCVEISATTREAQPHEVFDHFLARAVAEAHINDADQLAAFFGIQRSLVDRALRFLETIGHIQPAGDNIQLTVLGIESVRDGCRYVLKEDRHKLYFDSFTSNPLPASHYRGVTYLPEPTLTGTSGLRFQPVISLEPFDHDAIATLMARPDRRNFNVPDGLHDAKTLTIRQEWLPAYLIQNAGTPPYLAFTMAAEGRDHHIEALATAIADTLAAEQPIDPDTIWRQWLDTKGFTQVTPRPLPNGVLRATLPASAFETGGIRLYQLGSFEVRQTSFLQLWCDDNRVRRRAVLDRTCQRLAARTIKSPKDLGTVLHQLSGQLSVPPPSTMDVYTHARNVSDEVALAALDELTQAQAP